MFVRQLIEVTSATQEVTLIVYQICLRYSCLLFAFSYLVTLLLVLLHMLSRFLVLSMSLPLTNLAI